MIERARCAGGDGHGRRSRVLGCGRAVAALAAAWAGLATAAPGPQPISAAEVDAVVSRTMREFSVPGIAVGIVKDGRLVYARGQGVRRVGDAARVDADTVFAIGSNTKAFTAAVLATLVDEGKIHWDDRVIDYLPDFRLWDPYVTREFTIRDLLTHRSGLGLGAGDLLFVPKTDFSRRDVIRALRYLKPVSSFRSEFAYDNLLYMVAGELAAAASGSSWEDLVSARILGPLAMTGCAVSSERLSDHRNVASPHILSNGAPSPVPLLDLPVVGPAGSIQCNVTGMARWVEAQLGQGVAADGRRIFSESQSEEMWSAQTVLHPAGKRAALTRTHFAAYGLGWGLEDFNGYKRVSHNGGLPGMVTHVSLIPELHLGVIVLTNQQEGAALAAISLQILDAYTGAPKRDWVALNAAAKAGRESAIRAADAARAPAAGTAAPLALEAYVGSYEDAWRGGATVRRDGERLVLSFSHTDGLTGPMESVGPDLFIVRWNDRTLDADAYVRFSVDFSGKVSGFTMKAVSALTDFSFDFQDLDFRRVAAAPSGAH
ncbi:MAG: serine hydrolase [Proteobacteria bacterium]|nr:serine hydrolase [Pseudomonadota bacterium]